MAYATAQFAGTHSIEATKPSGSGGALNTRCHHVAIRPPDAQGMPVASACASCSDIRATFAT